MPRYAISDIHGCQRSFRALLERINFSKEDELYLLGDYIDRGPNSKGVIDHIWKLQNEGYFIKCLQGNHEQMLIDDLEKPGSWYYPGEKATLSSFNVDIIDQIPKKYIDWIKNLPRYFEVDEYILVHAGLNFKVEDPFSDKKQMLWIRKWYGDINWRWLKDRIIIHGHTPTEKRAIERRLEFLDIIPALDIDAGCVFKEYGYGWLCAFNLDTRSFTFQAYVG